jgi:(4S)-4-hydroxy-5-phosphonooxypentane-2,3-dione isomerase
MTGLAIVVEFRLQPGVRSQFRRLIDRNACISAQTEPGCRRFDVLEPEDQPDRVMLYEIYDDDAALEAHMKSAHFAQFDVESAPLLIDKWVIRCDLACEGSAGAAK